MKMLAILSAGTACIATPAFAQDIADGSQSRSVHVGSGADIVVTAPFVRDLDILAGKSVLTGEKLLEDMRLQIGETLTRLPGMSATSFAPGASRPVLRGFQGERIRVLSDGLGSLDVSNTSTDHAVTVDPLTAERIEVLHGPAVLLFGSQAIGGAVNVLDRRIPRGVPESGIHLDAIGSLGSAANERSGGAALDVALTPNIVLHADGSYRETGRLRVGGYVLSPGLRAEQRAIAEEEAEEGHFEEAAAALGLANLRGRLPDSSTRTYTLGGGLALINDGGSLGFSVGYFNSRYGVPMRPGAAHHHHDGEEEHEEEGEGEAHDHESVTIGLRQFRADMRGELKVDGAFIDSIRVRLGFADYRHTEFEGGEVGTLFESNAFEGRLELVQADRDGWRGVIGAQGFTRDFSAVGAEAFVPPNTTRQFGIFTLQEFDLGALGVELAGRYEHSRIGTGAVRLGLDEDAPAIATRRSFNAFSAAIGINHALTPDVKIGINGSRAVRAPSAEELFSNGPHIATQAYELGNPGFRTEKSWGVELYARGAAGPLRFQLSGYATWFDDYIYQRDTGLEADELPVFAYQQAGARYLGFEGELAATLVKRGDFTLEGNVVADHVRARLANGGGPVPRIPPLRVLAGLSATHGAVGGRVEVERVTPQRRVAAFETETDGFTLVNASLSWRPLGRDSETVLILSANNLFDVDARRHASFTKDFVPLPGRDLRLTARLSF